MSKHQVKPSAAIQMHRQMTARNQSAFSLAVLQAIEKVDDGATLDQFLELVLGALERAKGQVELES